MFAEKNFWWCITERALATIHFGAVREEPVDSRATQHCPLPKRRFCKHTTEVCLLNIFFVGGALPRAPLPQFISVPLPQINVVIIFEYLDNVVIPDAAFAERKGTERESREEKEEIVCADCNTRLVVIRLYRGIQYKISPLTILILH